MKHSQPGHSSRGDQSSQAQHSEHRSPYAMLLFSLAVSYAAMFLLMYSMGERWNNVYFNLSNVYMTA